MVRNVLSRVAWGHDLLVATLLFAAGFMIAVAFVMIIVDVSLRTLGISPPSFTIASVEYSLLYITMFAAPHLVRIKTHVFIDAFVSRLPTAARQVVEKICYIISIASSLIFAFYALQLLLAAIQSGNYEERGVDVPLWLLYWPIPLGFALVAVEFARFLFGSDSMYQRSTNIGSSV